MPKDQQYLGMSVWIYPLGSITVSYMFGSGLVNYISNLDIFITLSKIHFRSTLISGSVSIESIDIISTKHKIEYMQYLFRF